MDTVENSTNGQSSEDRGIGPEKLSVRIFREIFARSALSSGVLQSNLDEYLKTVLDTKTAKKSDRGYAKKIYTDLVRLVGGNGLPEWVSKTEKKPQSSLTDGDINEMLTGIPQDPPATPPAAPKSQTQMVAAADDYIDPNEISIEDPADVFLASINGTIKEEPCVFTAEDGPLKPILAEYVAKTVHPFIKVFRLGTKLPNGTTAYTSERYVAVGTFIGPIAKGENAGKKINVNFTVNPARTRRDIPEDVLMHKGGRAVQIMNEDERGCRRFLFVVKHKVGRKIRFWTRVAEVDHPNGGKFVILTDDEAGWKEVSRADF